MVKVAVFEVPPPGGELETVTEALPILGRSVEGMSAVSCELLTKAVGLAIPFQRTTDRDPSKKLLPFTVRATGCPARPVSGVIWVIIGFGLSLVMVKYTTFDHPPPDPGLKTLTGIFPAVAISAALMVALIREVFSKEVNLGLPFQ